MSERPLVAFTLLAQAAVGAFLVLGALDVAAALGAPAVPRSQVDAVLLAIGLAVVLALAAAPLHLGSPAAAWRAVANLRTSWLSREVLLALVFAVAGAAFAVARLSARGPAGLRPVLAAATALAGTALVYAMARVYRLRTVPAWDSPRTTVSFFAAAALLGALGVGAALVLLPRVPGASLAAPLRAIALAAAAAFAVELALPRPGPLHRVRAALQGTGLALALGALALPGLLVAAFAVALASETIGRYLFYVEGSRKLL